MDSNVDSGGDDPTKMHHRSLTSEVQEGNSNGSNEINSQGKNENIDLVAKPYVYADDTDGIRDVEMKHLTKQTENKFKKKQTINKALEKLGHNQASGKAPKLTRRGSLQNAVLGVLGRRRAQFRKENRALSFRPSVPENKSAWKNVPIGIISYQDPKRISWDILIFVLLIYIAMVTPIRIGFDQEASRQDEPFFYYLEKVIDVIFIVDILINFCTSYADDKNKEVVDHRQIAINYLQTWFVLDFISSIPLDWIMESQGGADGFGNIQAAKTARVAKAGRASKIVKITRVLKLTKLLRLAKGGKMWTKYMDVSIY